MVWPVAQDKAVCSYELRDQKEHGKRSLRDYIAFQTSSVHWTEQQASVQKNLETRNG